jgi:hypothetical protein
VVLRSPIPEIWLSSGRKPFYHKIITTNPTPRELCENLIMTSKELIVLILPPEPVCNTALSSKRISRFTFLNESNRGAHHTSLPADSQE